MNAKRKARLIGALVICMLIGLGWMRAGAQGPEPPYPAHRSERQPSYGPRIAEMSLEGVGRVRPQPHSALAEGEGLPLTVDLGEAGLSFRYVDTFGVTTEPYPADGEHINGPNGLFIDSSDNLYLVEWQGYRMLKYDLSGENQLIIGHAGQPWHHNDFLSYPADVALDPQGDIWIGISTALKEFDSAGNLKQIFPAEEPWVSGDENDRFESVEGLAFDSSGDLFVADTDNHRVQIYTFSGGGPVYTSTIGVTGVSGTDNSHFNWPTHLAFDSSDRLYVADYANHRIQRCEYGTSWSCDTFVGEASVSGVDLNHLNMPYGIDVDETDNVFIADSLNFRVLKCDIFGSCGLFAGESGVAGTENTHLGWPSDVVADSRGSVYVSDWNNHRIQKFDGAGTYMDTIGVSRIPYTVDTTRINQPWGISLGADGSLYVTEKRGFRLVKIDNAGPQIWVHGEAGIYGEDDMHLGGWGGPEGNSAVDSTGQVYVSDTSNNRVQIFNSSGTLVGTFGTWGTGNYNFNCPAGVATSPVNGDIYVVDRCNQRIQVYNSNRIYKATLGVTGETGADSDHFNWPRGVAVDSTGNIFVADTDNFRVQKCTLSDSSGICTTFIGETGVFSASFEHLFPLSVMLDDYGRVYVSDERNNRVQVFDAAGSYLTTIGGAWESTSGGLRGPSGVALDDDGNLYVTDRDNHRVQKFAPGVSDWEQININGFGDIENAAVTALTPFGQELYAGTYNYGGASAQLWRLINGGWSAVNLDGFGFSYNVGIDHLIEFNGDLYAGTWADADNGGEVWRSSSGTSWSRVVSDGFGDPTNAEVFLFEEFDGEIYASTWSYTSAHGAEIWSSNTGDLGDWSRMVANGFGDAENYAIPSFRVKDGYLYAATSNSSSGTEVWRTDDGTNWSQINTDGFGDADNREATLEAFYGYLYAGVRNYVGSDNPGTELWRCQDCDGGDWEQVVVPKGFGDTENRALGMVKNGHVLYALTLNVTSGVEVWWTKDGVEWGQVNINGFGDSNNLRSFWSNSAAVFENSLFLGTLNWANGGEIWEHLEDIETFGDVSTDHWAWNWIEALYASGITSGCSSDPMMYCPEDSVTRAQMAVFLERGMRGSEYTPPTATGAVFDDVTSTHWAAGWIEQLYSDGITTGCSSDPMMYCPEDPVNRAQMAVFLERAMHWPDPYSPPGGTGTLFDDVSGSYWAVDWIEQLYADGITSGCSSDPLMYCPDSPVTRAQMAVFLVRSFELSVP